MLATRGDTPGHPWASALATSGDFNLALDSCEFVETEDQVFRYDDIRAALDPAAAPFAWAA